MEKKELSVMKKTAIYLCGITMVSLGIVLCKKSSLGISPISSIPFVLEDILHLSFGNLTMLFHFFNTGLQMILRGRKPELKLLLQFPLAFVFGTVIDLIQKLVVFDNSILLYQFLSLVFSILFTALGMVCMISMNLVQNPPDGTVRQISRKMNWELGKTKNLYDIICVIVSVTLGMVFLGKIKGFGIATIASALLVGRCVSWIRKGIEIYKIKERKICY